MINRFQSIHSQNIVTQSLDHALYEAFRKANDINNTDMMNAVLNSVQNIMRDSFFNCDHETFNTIGYLTVYFYNLTSSSNYSISLIERLAISLKSLSFSGYLLKESNKPTIAANITNVALYDIMSSIIHYSILNKSQQLKKIINEFNNFHFNPYNKNINKSLERHNLIHEKNSPLEIEKIFRTIEELNKANYIAITHRKSALIIFSWACFCYNIHLIDEDTINTVIKKLELRYAYFEDLIEDYIFLTDYKNRNFLHIDQWDYIERESGVLYHPLVPEEWISLGVCVYIIKKNTPHFHINTIDINEEYAFLSDHLVKSLDTIKQNSKIWNSILANNINEESTSVTIERKTQEILLILSTIDQKLQLYKQQKVHKNKIDSKKIKEFEIKLAERWKQEYNFPEMFRHFGALSITNEPIVPITYRQFLKNLKSAFTAEDSIDVFGITDIGAIAGRQMSYSLIESILIKNVPDEISENSTISIDDAIKSLKGKKYNPSIIILPSDLTYKSDLTRNEKFKYIYNENKLPFHIIGMYEDIPVVSFYFEREFNNIIIADVNKAFLLQMTEVDGYFNQLKIIIKEPSDEEINIRTKQLDSMQEKYSIVEIETKKLEVINSVTLDMVHYSKLKITDPEAYIIL